MLCYWVSTYLVVNMIQTIPNFINSKLFAIFVLNHGVKINLISHYSLIFLVICMISNSWLRNSHKKWILNWWETNSKLITLLKNGTSIYRKVASSRLSRLVAHFQTVNEGEFYAYVLWPLKKLLENWIVDRSTARDFTVVDTWISASENDIPL